MTTVARDCVAFTPLCVAESERCERECVVCTRTVKIDVIVYEYTGDVFLHSLKAKISKARLIHVYMYVKSCSTDKEFKGEMSLHLGTNTGAYTPTYRCYTFNTIV